MIGLIFESRLTWVSVVIQAIADDSYTIGCASTRHYHVPSVEAALPVHYHDMLQARLANAVRAASSNFEFSYKHSKRAGNTIIDRPYREVSV